MHHSDGSHGLHFEGSAVNSESDCRVELMFRCHELMDEKHLASSQPYVLVEIEEKGKKRKIDRTESVKDTASPHFKHGIIVPFHFSLHQDIHISIMDDNPAHPGLISHAVCTLAKIVASKTGITISLASDKGAGETHGTIEVQSEKVISAEDSVTFHIKCEDVKDVEIISKSDPFVRILKANKSVKKGTPPESIPDKDWDFVHQTEHVNDNLNPVFEEFTLELTALCDGNIHKPLKFEIYDYEDNSESKIIGWSYTTFYRLLKGDRTINTKNYKDSPTGKIIVTDLVNSIVHDIIDYITHGVKLCYSVAVDFTQSNGDPKFGSSLHHLNAGKPNQYQEVITQVGRILSEFGSENEANAYGFAGKINGEHSDVFALNCVIGGKDTQVKGWEGALHAYATSIASLQLSNPRHIAPVLLEFRNLATQSYHTNPLLYHVALIVTNGSFVDEEESKQIIAAMENLPISILIVGVGADDFKQMDRFDAHTSTSHDPHAKREFVQFIKFADYKGNHHSMSEALLRNVPKQLNSFYTKIGLVID